VAAVDGNGWLNPLRAGVVTLQASLGNVTGSKTVEIVTSLTGPWLVSMTVRQCEQTGRPVGEWWLPCGSPILNGPLATRLYLSHEADDARRVNGWFSVGGVEAFAMGHCEAWTYGDLVPLAGHVSSDGHLAVEGTAVTEVPVYFAVGTHWTIRGDTRLVSSDELIGAWTLEVSAPSGRSFWAFTATAMANVRHHCD
jgi:hypothetical protein